MGLFSMFSKKSKERKERFTFAKLLCLIAALDEKISEEEIVRVLAGLEFLEFNIEDITQDEITIIWKEAAEIAAASRRFGITSETVSEFFDEVKNKVALWDYKKRVNLLMVAAKVAELREKVTLTSGELDILAGLARAIRIDSEHLPIIIKPVLDKWDILGGK